MQKFQFYSIILAILSNALPPQNFGSCPVIPVINTFFMNCYLPFILLYYRDLALINNCFLRCIDLKNPCFSLLKLTFQGQKLYFKFWGADFIQLHQFHEDLLPSHLVFLVFYSFYKLEPPLLFV